MHCCKWSWQLWNCQLLYRPLEKVTSWSTYSGRLVLLLVEFLVARVLLHAVTFELVVHVVGDLHVHPLPITTLKLRRELKVTRENITVYYKTIFLWRICRKRDHMSKFTEFFKLHDFFWIQYFSHFIWKRAVSFHVENVHGEIGLIWESLIKIVIILG